MMITGSGMVASALVEAAGLHGWDALIYGHEWLDVTDAAAVRRLAIDVRPDMIVHTAALTKVNYCEENEAEAMRVNRDGTANVLAAAEDLGASLVYLSTDYVFDGTAEDGWLEGAAPAPLNAYGRSKLAGEELVRGYGGGIVVRTSGVFGPVPDGSERNFFKAIAEKLAAGDEAIPVVADQFTAVTYAPHLARMLLSLLPDPPARLIHLTSRGADSWHGWAGRVAQVLGKDASRLTPAVTEDLPGQTVRPRQSVLTSKYPAVSKQVGLYPAQMGIEAYFAAM